MESTSRIVIGVNDKKKKVLARIDTGAAFTSIDETVARKIGYLNIMKEFEDRLVVCGEKIYHMNHAERKEYFSSITGLKNFVKINSANGFSFRPVVDITFNIGETDIRSRATIIDRSHLKYPVIIGRKDLGGFLVKITGEKI